MKFFNYLIILSTIIFIEDFKLINSIFVKIYHNNLPCDNNPINLRYNQSELIINLNNIDKKCNLINNYNNLNIITYNNGLSKKFLLKCNQIPYVTIIKCNKYLENCSYNLVPSLSYRCFPSNLCNINFYDKINAILYIN